MSVLLDLVHVLLGAAGLLLAGSAELAHRYLVGAGIVLLALWALGVAKTGGWVPLDLADDWLHLGLGAALLALARVTAP